MTIETARSFGRWLQQQRKAHDLTQAQLARLVGCAAETIRKLEADTRRPSQQLAELLADQLNIPLVERAAFVARARAGGAPTEPAPPTRGNDSQRPPMPMPMTPLIDRDAEIAQVQALLHSEAVRLITLYGPPGVGKTRLALQIASAADTQFPGGVLFVPLSDIAQPDGVLRAIGQRLGLAMASGPNMLATLARYLRETASLILLDGFEQTLGAAPQIIDLLTAVPQLTILVTSRVVLRVLGEHEFAVPPLELPDLRQPALELAHNPAIELFVQRARAVRPDFSLTAQNVAQVAELCIHLDGIPLAIELAAACCKLLAPAELLAHVRRRLQALAGPLRSAPMQRQTLRAAIAETVAALPPTSTLLFVRLAVFVGGFTYDAIMQVCQAQPSPSLTTNPQLLNDLAILIDHSLLQSLPQPNDERRFAMLELIREYALELRASYDDAPTHERHAAHFLQLAERSRSALVGQQQLSQLARLDAERGNLRAALQWARDRAATGTSVRLALALWPFWYLRGAFQEGLAWITDILNTNPAAAPNDRADRAVPLHWRSELLLGSGALALAQGDDTRARGWLNERLALDPAASTQRNEALALYLQGHLATRHEHSEQAIVYYRRSLAIWRALDDHWGSAMALASLGDLHGAQGDLLQARALIEESVALVQLLKDHWLHASMQRSLGTLLLRSGDYTAAAACYAESLRLADLLQHRQGRARALNGMGDLALAQRQLEGAWGHYRSSLQLCQALEDRVGIITCLERLATVQASRTLYAHAAQLCGHAAMLRAQSGLPPPPTSLLVAARDQLGASAWARAQAEGATLTLEQLFAATR